MFERFTDRARRVIVLAQEEARLLNHGHIGCEHVLLGLVSEGEGVAAKTLAMFGVTLETARAEVRRVTVQGAAEPRGHIPFIPECKKVLEVALREALGLGHNYIGTEHILLGLIRSENPGTIVLRHLQVDLAQLRRAVLVAIAPIPEDTSPVGPKPLTLMIEREDAERAVRWIEAYRLLHVEDWMWDDHYLRPLLMILEQGLA